MIKFKQIDPDDAFSIVPYEKGFLLLYYLETLVGKDVFQKILQKYIKTFRLKSIVYTDFIRLFEEESESLLGRDKFELIRKEIDWNHWIIENGIPNKKFNYSKIYLYQIMI